MSARTRFLTRFLAAAAVMAAAGCDTVDVLSPSDPLEPRNLDARYEWLLEGWQQSGLAPVGRPTVTLTWELPSGWNDQPFRIYSRRTGQSYLLIATVTSCGSGVCNYTDANVSPGASYDYYVATYLDRENREIATESAIRVDVPRLTTPTIPAAPTATALDGALYLRWPSTGADYYQVFLEREDGTQEFLLLGQTDGTSYLDERAENGTTYGYRIAAVDSLGHLSSRSELGSGTPRPDYHAEVAYALADSAAASGFRFVTSDASNPVVSGASGTAQWRLERSGSTFRIVPLGATAVSGGTFTTALACGPGEQSAGEECIAVATAPADASFSTASVTAEPGYTYVLRVSGDDGRTHYGKVRVIGATTDSRGLPVLVFDWAYQLLPDTRSLFRGGA